MTDLWLFQMKVAEQKGYFSENRYELSAYVEYSQRFFLTILVYIDDK